jgi:site-specific DNA-methyltransferase (adenine-specific)
MKLLPDKSIDCIICDLPYGTTQNKWDSVIPFDKLWGQYKRIIKDNGCIALFADGMFMSNLMQSNTKMWRYNLVWDKELISGFLNANRMPLRVHEEICIFYKKLPTYNPQFTEGIPLHSRGNKAKQVENGNRNYGKYNSRRNPSDKRVGSTQKHPKSILRFPRPASCVMQHPTQKPVELLEWLVKTYTNEDDVVLDNCMGSGTTGVACKNLNRKFIGIELEDEYFNIAKERILD